MSTLREQLIALGGVFQAAVLVDRIARTGQASEANIGSMLGSFLVGMPTAFGSPRICLAWPP